MNTKNSWTKIQPSVPEHPPSDWYWYWEPGAKEPFVVELWPGRYIKHYNGWWGPMVSDKPEDPPDMEEDKKKQRRRRKNE